jgi:hypothetical protein
VCRVRGVPYFAIVVDAGEMIRGFILPMTKLLTLSPKGNAASGWKMTERYLVRYAADPAIQTFTFQTKTAKWWGQQVGAADAHTSPGRPSSR